MSQDPVHVAAVEIEVAGQHVAVAADQVSADAQASPHTHTAGGTEHSGTIVGGLIDILNASELRSAVEDLHEEGMPGRLATVDAVQLRNEVAGGVRFWNRRANLARQGRAIRDVASR